MKIKYKINIWIPSGKCTLNENINEKVGKNEKVENINEKVENINEKVENINEKVEKR